MFDVNNWLNTTLPNGNTVKDYLCFLVLANGGFIVTGWGIISVGSNGHRQGLEQNEALDLLRYEAFINGLDVAGVNFHLVFKPIFDEYVKQFQN